MVRHVRGGVVAAATILFCLGAVPASANFIATGQDPVGDSADAHPARHSVTVAPSYDRRPGHLRGGVRLAGEPSSETAANLTVFAGRRTATGCNGYPAIGFATQTDLTGAVWVKLAAPGAPAAAEGRATKLYDGPAEEYEATAAALTGERPNCVIAQLNEPGNPAVVYDVAGPYPLRALPELDAQLRGLPATVRPAQTRVVRLVLRNPGDAPTGRVRLGAAGARGMTVQLPRVIPSLRPGQARTVPVRVTLNRAAASTTTLRLTAIAASGPRAIADGRLQLRTPTRPSGGAGSGGGPPGGSKLCFRYTWLPPYSQLVPC